MSGNKSNDSVDNSNSKSKLKSELEESDVKVYLTSVYASSITSKLNGYFVLQGEKIKFRGIAFGRIGGHNVHVKISKQAETMIRKMGYDPEQMIIEVQRKMIEGDITIVEQNSSNDSNNNNSIIK